MTLEIHLINNTVIYTVMLKGEALASYDTMAHAQRFIAANS